MNLELLDKFGPQAWVAAVSAGTYIRDGLKRRLETASHKCTEVNSRRRETQERMGQQIMSLEYEFFRKAWSCGQVGAAVAALEAKTAATESADEPKAKRAKND